MSNVYANGREISGKASGNKSIAAMPDVCLSPPAPPAGPVPIPYPNTSMASDTTEGSKTVKVRGEQAGLKNASYYKTSNGNQPATQNFGAGVVTHKLQGATKHAAWSFDVKIEGQNVIRHMDLTTHNHANPTNGAMTSDLGLMNPSVGGEPDCRALQEKNEDERKKLTRARGKGTKGRRKIGTESTTVSHAVYKPSPGSALVMKAFSRVAIRRFDNAFLHGLTKDEKKLLRDKKKKRVKSRACGEHHYNPSAWHPMSHTESRIIESIFRQFPEGGGTLLLSISWRKGNEYRDRPCEHCQKLLCEAKKCIDIRICNSKTHQPKSLKCEGNKAL